MYKLKKRGFRILKIFHLLAVCCWFGGAASMLLLNLKSSVAVSEGVLYGINTASHLIDTWVIAAFGALGCIITGIMYGIFTTWGFFKHKWIIGKWVITAAALTTAILFLGPAVETMLELSSELGTDALHNQAYLAVKSSHLYVSLLQIALYALMIILSVIKPWGKTGKNPAPTRGKVKTP